MDSLKEVCHWGVGFRVSKAHPRSSVNLSLSVPSDQGVSSLLRCHSCLPAVVIPAVMVMDCPSKPEADPQLNAFFFK